MTWTKRTAALAMVMTLAACGGEEAPEAEAVVVEPTGAMEGMGDMQGMGGMQMGGGMVEQMQRHMQQLQGASGAQLKANLAQHRQMVANMVSQYGREMREMMPMAEDSEWSQTIEALRQDLRQMPEMSAQELDALLPEHRQRVARLMEMHREMMAEMHM